MHGVGGYRFWFSGNGGNVSGNVPIVARSRDLKLFCQVTLN